MAYNNVQFLDLSGVDEDEKKWILTSLQTCDSCVEGPWNKFHDETEVHQIHPECTIQTNINNGLPPMSFEQYPSPPMIISNHVSPISSQVYPQTYQSPIQIYQPALFSQVQYAAPMVPVVPINAPMVPVQISNNPPYGQPVSYATYPPPVQANPIYIPPVVKEPVINHHHNQHHQPLQQQQPLPVLHQHNQQQQTVHKGIPQQQQQPPPTIQVVSGGNTANVHINMKQNHHVVANGPLHNVTSPIQVQQVQPYDKMPSPPVNQTLPVSNVTQTNGHDHPHTTNGIRRGSNATSPTSTEAVSTTPSEVYTSPSASSENTSTTSGPNAPAPAPTAAGAANDSGTGMSWASLFNKKNNIVEHHKRHEGKSPNCSLNATQLLQTNVETNISDDLEENCKESHLAEIGDPNYYRMGEILINYAPDNKITSLQPRGLINRSNYCYINSILQALLACPPMYNLLSSLGHHISLKEHRKHSQIIDNMINFVNEFHHLPAAQRVNRRSDKQQKKEQPTAINYDRPFEPNWIYKMLNGMRSDSFVVEGRQEDAEEFLGCLLNGLNDEMLELMKLVGPEVKKVECVIEDGYKSDGDKEWQVIGPKNKGCITRRTEIVRTPISDIFGGHILSKLHRTGDLITNNIQPFFTLQLNIEKVNTVREALEALVCKNQLEGVTSSKTNEEVEAWQQVTIQELPVVLILHLKCFDFKLDGCTKIVKALEFPVDLKIDTKLLSSKTNYQPKQKQYKLFAVVYHDGKEATKGHYLTDAYHVGYASWLRYDDATVKTVQEEQVLKPHGTRVPYLLFYRRCDTVRSK